MTKQHNTFAVGDGDWVVHNQCWVSGEPPMTGKGVYQFNDRTDNNKPYIGSGNLRSRLSSHMNHGRFLEWQEARYFVISPSLEYNTTFMSRVAERVQMFNVSGGDLNNLANDRWVLNGDDELLALRAFFDNPPPNWQSEFAAPSDPRFFTRLPPKG